MEGLEMVCFQMITAAGGARSCFIEAIQEAKNGNFAEAEEALKNGNELFVEGHRAHGDLIAKEASGQGEIPTLLLVHAEDQMMSAETFSILAEEWVELCRQLHELKAQISSR